MNSIPTLPVPPRPALQLFVWGASADGQLGLGTFLDNLSKPRRHLWAEKKIQDGGFGTESGAGLVDIAAGGMHTLLLDENSVIWSCGVNDNAALGRLTDGVPDPDNDGSFLDKDQLSSTFHPIQSLIDEGFRAVRIVAGDSISAAVSEQGQLRVWGSFRDSQGHHSFTGGVQHQYSPQPYWIQTPKAELVSSIASGGNHLVILTDHGSVYTCGDTEDSQLGRKLFSLRHKKDPAIPQRILLGDSRSRRAVVIGAGQTTSFAVDTSGNVWAWGMNSHGQTGTGSHSSEYCLLFVEQPTKVIGLNSEDRVVQIAGGQFHTLFLTSSGKVYACGWPIDGQLGLPDDHEAFNGRDRSKIDFVAKPARVELPEENDPVVHIFAGPRCSMAIKQSGIFFSWGLGCCGELGLGAEVVYTPRNVTRREGAWSVRKVSCGGQHAVGLLQRRL